MADYDFIIVGAGIIGLATAMRLQERYPRARLAILDKEARVAAHQSGHNSGVIHAGVYYEPGSLKARLCRAGLLETIAFCRANGIPFKQCGKLIVGTTQQEVHRLEQLSKRARSNGAECHTLTKSELNELEPNINGLAALEVVETGIVDYAEICRKMHELLVNSGAVFKMGAEVTAIRESADSVQVEDSVSVVTGKHLIVCAGLQSDRLARIAGLAVDFAIVPFRGDFYCLRGQRADIVSRLIYPVPDPSLPFLGVHLTPTIYGAMTVGPSAMLALNREAYRKLAVSVTDIVDIIRYPGLWKLLLRYPLPGLTECIRTFSKRAYLAAIRKYCPTLELSDLFAPQCGVRAQAVSSDGRLIQDFVIKSTTRTTHVCNAPSPAATAAIPIADFVVGHLGKGASKL
ncbi:MAG TPA: L-2-hydroxyglutarate oxidase [Gammaproteobacteria bacterium]|nr:L-2-hydroxyglutarate oxidase [Gammaproteobacteria bacterium]